MHRTLKDILESSVAAFHDRPAFSEIGGSACTYGDFKSRSEKLARLFSACGIGKGDKVVLFSGSQVNWPVAYFSVTANAMVIVPLLPDFTAFELANIIEHSGASDLIVSRKLYYKISDFIYGTLRTVIIADDFSIVKSAVNGIGTDGKPSMPSGVPMDEFLAGSKADCPCQESVPEEDDIASIIYTSGTSGSSKGVMLSHKNLTAQIEMIYKLFPIVKEDVFLSILPLSHAYECTIGMIYPFAYGSSVVYLNSAPTPSALMSALAEVRPTIMLSVPLIVEKIYKNKLRPIFTKNAFMEFIYSIPLFRHAFHRIAGKKLYRMFGGRLRFFGIGGSKLDAVVENFLKDAGFPYSIGYGLTETSPLIAGAVPGKVPFQSTGPIVHGMELKLLNINDSGIGEIAVKGDNVMAGYYRDEKRTRAAFTEDGWFRTKDLGCLDRYGNLYIKGRADNMIVGANGENIYPEEIESIINESDYVTESLVVSVKGRLIAKVHFNYDYIEKLHRFSENSARSLSERIDILKKELREYVNSKVNKTSKVEIEEQSSPFEKTATQKIKRYLYS